MAWVGRKAGIISAVLTVLSTGTGVMGFAGPDGSAGYGVWKNPSNSVHVEIRGCGKGGCGYVVWANDKAKADARRGGTKQLIGVQLFREFTRQPNGSWKGKVFVPDLNKILTGTVTPQKDGTLRARGCLVAGIGCKSQIWTRLK